MRNNIIYSRPGIRETFSSVVSDFEEAGISSARINAEAILCAVLGCSRTQLYTEEDSRIDQRRAEELNNMVLRRINGEPLQYIIGRIDFYGNELFIEPGVFIPRPETEILVDTAISLYQLSQPQAGQPSAESIDHKLILDLCTGSGNIAISLTKALTRCRIIASDISDKALALAKRNALLNNVSDRIDFIKSDLFKILRNYIGTFDIIVSNPPYIARHIIEGLPAEVRKEPEEALDGGDDGAGFYSRIIEESPLFLKRDGFIILELGDDMHTRVRGLLTASGNFKEIGIFKDLNGIERVIAAKKI